MPMLCQVETTIHTIMAAGEVPSQSMGASIQFSPNKVLFKKPL